MQCKGQQRMIVIVNKGIHSKSIKSWQGNGLIKKILLRVAGKSMQAYRHTNYIHVCAS